MTVKRQTGVYKIPALCNMNHIDRYCERYGNTIIWVFIAAYVAIFSYICALKYFSFGYHDWDFASEAIILWNSVHGKLFYYPFLEQSIFGAHLYLIIIFLIPIYAIFQHPVTLLLLQSLFLGLAAYPLYLLARLNLNKTFALAISLVYLLYPSLGYINLFETHFDIYAIFFLFFSLYYFEKESLGKFIVFIILAAACKEAVSMSIFMFGIYAMVRKRPYKWILTPLILGLAWFLLSIKVIIPYFAKEANLYPGGFIFSVYYLHLGNSISEMIHTLIFHILTVARFAFTPGKIQYLLNIFVPTSFAGLLSPAVLLMTVPIFMQNLLSSAPTHSQIYYQYVAILIPFIFASTIFGLKKALGNRPCYDHRHILLFVFLIVSIVSGIYLKAPQLYFVKYLRTYCIGDLAKKKDRLIRMIPKNSSVISTFQFLPKLANRYHLYSLHFVSTGFKMYTSTRYEPPRNLEYALIDFNEPLMINSFFPPEAAANIRNFIENGNWKVLSAIDDVVLFKKDLKSGYPLYEVIENPNVEHLTNANIDNKMVFVGYDIFSGSQEQDGTLHLALYWKRIGTSLGPLGFFTEFLGPDDQVIFTKASLFGYRIYSFETLPVDQVVMIHSYIMIPSSVKIGVYKLRAGLFTLENGKMLPVTDNTKTDSLGRMILGNVLITR